MGSIRIWCALGLALFISTTCFGQGQTERREDVLQARLIKVKRMSEAWENEPLQLRLFDGSNHSGKFFSIQDSMFRLKARNGFKEFPVADVEAVVLQRKPQDLLLVGLASVGVAGLFAGGARLGFEASDDGVIGASAAGAVVGFAFGWKAFYQNIVIPLD